MREIAIVGNPNSGKSTLFNALTGARQRVGNWPGVTVEKKTGTLRLGENSFEVIDLPGLYSIHNQAGGEDERIVQDYLRLTPPDCIVNVVDATTLSRSLYLTTQLRETGIPLIIALNKSDVAEAQQITIDTNELSKELGCPVVPIIARKRGGLGSLREALTKTATTEPEQPTSLSDESSGASTPENRFEAVDELVSTAVDQQHHESKLTQFVDRVVLNKYLAFPIFLFVMYLMFTITINVGSAFIDLFDILGSALFVEGPRWLYNVLGFPTWLTAFLADGVGGGVQLVGTFIPVIACLFLFLSVLEDTGYMGRIAFILDRLMQQLGLPGKSFVALIVGFGCNVPSVMATRTMDNKPDRILATLMAPFMSCGARLTVYTLFAAAFFPTNGQNVVFLLYLLGIVVAIGSAWAVRKHLLPTSNSSFSLELPHYHLPTLRNVLTTTWHRLSGFVTRAGKAIVLVVIVLNVVNSVGTDGTFGNDNSEKSVLSQIGKTITPLFHPMGIDEENWPATVGIFTGMFAKEVVVGTLDALYSPADRSDEFDFLGDVAAAFQSVPDNLSGVGDTLLDPLGISLDEVTDLEEAASDQEVEINTVQAMQGLFHGELGAFSYLVFILLYMPCVATIGVIYKEIGSFWAVFSTVWSVVIAYTLAVSCYQLGNIAVNPVESLVWTLGVLSLAGACFGSLVYCGKQRSEFQEALIPVRSLD